MTIIKETVGKTPLVKLEALSNEYGVELYGKCEFMNPSGSVKDRAAYAMIHDALDAGIIHKDTHIIEPPVAIQGLHWHLFVHLWVCD